MNHKNNVVLIGFMGCGKTTIGDGLAYRLKYSFIDTDKQIEDEMGTTINNIFKMYGEQYFRQLEHNIIKNINKKNRQVIATGGGIIKNKNNINELKKNGIILYLKASSEHIYNNLKEDNSRPLLQVNNKSVVIEQLLNERKYLYEKYADIIVNVSNNTVENTINTIIEKIGEKYC